MRIDVEEESTGETLSRTLTSISTNVERVGDILLNPRKFINFTIPTFDRKEKPIITFDTASFFNRCAMRAFMNRQWEQCATFLLSNLFLKSKPRKNDVISKLLSPTDEVTDKRKINTALGLSIGLLFVTMIISFGYNILTDVIESVVFLFGVVGFVALLMGFSLLIMLIGVFFATQ